MATPILMPALSPTMKDGTLARWLKNEGDEVKSGDILAEIETDKATMEVEAIDDGILGKILVEGGSKNVPVNDVIGVLSEPGEDINVDEFKNSASNKPAAEAPAEAAPQEPAPTEKAPEQPTTPAASAAPAPTPQAEKQGRILASPLAKRIAADKNINLSTVQGSGPKGRIVKADLENVGNQAAASAPVIDDSVNPSRLEPHSTMREAIARRLVEAKSSIPHFYLRNEIHMDELLKLRASVNAQLGVKISVNDFIIKASALALIKVPGVNASFTDEGMRYYTHADVSVAVAIDGGLITPIVKHADRKSLVQISQESKELIGRARDMKLKPHEYEGGTFSVSNLGMMGISEFAAIINPPQSCILAVGATEKKAVIDENDDMHVASIMTCTLSCDHRVVDGALGAEFLKTLKELIENPLSLLTIV